MTHFEKDLKRYVEGTAKFPRISAESGEIPFPLYQITVHIGQCKLYAKKIVPFRGFKLKPIKEYYGLKSKTSKQCVVELQKIYKQVLDKHHLGGNIKRSKDEEE